MFQNSQQKADIVFNLMIDLTRKVNRHHKNLTILNENSSLRLDTEMTVHLPHGSFPFSGAADTSRGGFQLRLRQAEANKQFVGLLSPIKNGVVLSLKLSHNVQSKNHVSSNNTHWWMSYANPN
jgi:hypothetical protein